jgi:hypothetical protein
MKRVEKVKKWIEVLRSGGYSQTRNTLRDDDGHCCLGVFLEVDRPSVKWDDDFYPKVNGEYLVDGNGDYIEGMYHGNRNWMKNFEVDLKEIDTKKHRKIGELVKNTSSNLYEIRNTDGTISLSNMLSVFNDEGCNFKQIANFLEDYVLPRLEK